MSDPYTCLTLHERTIREDLGHDDTTLVSDSIAGVAGYLAWVLTDLARAEDHTETLTSLLADSGRLLAHAEAARSNSTTPERGIPCPDCVTEGKKREQDAPRLVRHYGHWCVKHGCDRLHYLDDSGDVWRCPREPEHEWSHKDYEDRLMERKKSA